MRIREMERTVIKELCLLSGLAIKSSRNCDVFLTVKILKEVEKQ